MQQCGKVNICGSLFLADDVGNLCYLLSSPSFRKLARDSNTQVKLVSALQVYENNIPHSQAYMFSALGVGFSLGLRCIM